MTGLAPSFHLPAGVSDAATPVRTQDDLVAYMRAGCKQSVQDRRLGVEYERLPLLATGEVAPFAGDTGSVQSVLRFLSGMRGLEPQEEEGHLLGLAADFGSIHLEPGGQLELALQPVATAREVLPDLEWWREALMEAAKVTGVHVVSLGLQPRTPIADIGWVPKRRYALMSSHLGERGSLAHHMMKGTAGVQLNLDYLSEQEAAEMMRSGLAVSSLVNALVVNSPLEEGKPNGFLSKRPAIWEDTDPHRTGLLPWVQEEGFSFARYSEWALEAPVMFLIRNEEWLRVGGRSFGDLLGGEHEFGDLTLTDWHLHLTTMFPEVRIKQHLETRGMDSCDIPLVAGLSALWRALLYDETARKDGAALLDGLPAASRLELHEGVGRVGLRAGEGLVGELAVSLLKIARTALEDLDPEDAELLGPLEEIAAEGRSPAEDLLDDVAERGTLALLDRI